MKSIPTTFSEADLIAARRVFRQHESRDIFYRAARELIRLAIAKQTEITLAEALGTLLQTWNSSFYRFHGRFDEPHIRAIEDVIHDNSEQLDDWRTRAITSMRAEEEESIAQVFIALEKTVGPVGAAKALHLLAPGFFPLWDRAIASHYQVALQRMGHNGENYLRFMEITKQQVSGLHLSSISDGEVLKMIDEYNYCLITKGWT